MTGIDALWDPIRALPFVGAALAAVVLVAVAVTVLRLRRRLARAEQGVAELRAEVAALCAGASGADRRVARLEQAVRRMGERQDRLELSRAGERAYDHAIRLVRGGAGLERLVSECGLTVGEARLILMLHGEGGRERATPSRRAADRARA